MLFICRYLTLALTFIVFFFCPEEQSSLEEDKRRSLMVGFSFLER